MRHTARASALGLVAAFASAVMPSATSQPPPRPTQQGPPPRFKSGVELVNVAATVTDASGRFVPGLSRDDFQIFDDDEPQAVTHFSADRIPVSLGILLDTSQSMQGEKFSAARSALDRFLADLSSPDDEFFLMQFSSTPALLQEWTPDRARISRALAGVSPRGGTALYDAIADSLPLVRQASNHKKALVIISDGNDMTSDTPASKVRARIRESEALVYAIGIDCRGASTRRPPLQQRGPIPTPFPFPMPGRGRPPQFPPAPQQPGRNDFYRCSDPVDVISLRDLTDDSGGRTEVVRDARDLDPATTGIADELSRQYDLGYPSPGKKDGRWHTIRVEVRNKSYRVRARRGYVASIGDEAS